MKNALLLLILHLIPLVAIIAQEVEEYSSGIQTLVLVSGEILNGKIEEVNRKTIVFSIEDNSFLINKEDIRNTFPDNIFEGNLDTEIKYEVIMHNKVKLKGQLIEASRKNTLLKMDGKLLSVPTSKILRIYPLEQERKDEMSSQDLLSLEQKQEPEQKQEHKKKIYNITYAGLTMRNIATEDIFRAEDETFDGYTFQHTTGYRFNKNFGIGLDLGLSYYKEIRSSPRVACYECFFNSVDNVNVISLGLSIRGELNEKKIRPFYNIDFGFNKVLRDRQLNSIITRFSSFERVHNKAMSATKLGYQFHPAFGLLVKMKSMNLLIDLGYQLTSLNYNTGEGVFVEDREYFFQSANSKLNSVVLRIGLSL